ncbi:MAG: GNAT family N-acetyltransferase [Cytophagales bacterium]|nr:GNAT family N-acetyltransferase [Cytophagales bacterium]
MNKSFTLGVSAARMQRFRTALDACENVANHLASKLSTLKPGLVIRGITAKDNTSIARFLNHIFLYKGHLASEALQQDQELSDIYRSYKEKNAFFGVMINDKEVVGTIGFKPMEDHEVCKLKKFHLCPEFTSPDHANKLLNYALDKARSMNFNTCMIQVLPGEPELQNFLLMHGFNPSCGEIKKSGNYLCREL